MGVSWGAGRALRGAVAVIAASNALVAPAICRTVWMERFSPLFADRDLFPVTSLRAEK